MAYGWDWTEEKFFNSTPEYFFKAWKGKSDKEMRALKASWEQLRLLGSWVLAPHSKNLTPIKLLPLPWDKAKTRETFLEENKELIPLWDKLSK